MAAGVGARHADRDGRGVPLRLPEQAAADLAPLRALGEPLANLIQVKEYAAHQTLLDATKPTRQSLLLEVRVRPRPQDGLLETYHAQFVDLTAPANQIVLFHLAGALSEHPEDDGALGNRDAAFACVIQSMWAPDSPAADANRVGPIAWEALKPFSTGGNYVNFQTDDEPQDRTRAAFGSNFDRLRRSRPDTTRPTSSG